MRNIEFIMAGAGSGKTYKLTSLLVDNIENGNCSASEVIMTTFTKKAASELRSRAMEALLEKGKHEDANLLSSALIGTVHSVAFSLIKKYWYYLGISPDMKEMPQEDAMFFISQSLSKLVTPDEINKLHRLAVLLSFKDDRSSINYNVWKQHLRNILDYARANRITDLTPFKEDSVRIINSVFPAQNTLNIDPDDLLDTLRQLRELFNNDADNPTTRDRIKSIEEILSKNTLELSDLIKVRSVLKKTTKKHKDDNKKIEGYLNTLAGIYNSDMFVSPIMEYIELVFELTQRSLDEFIQYKKEHNLIDFNDMEAYLLDLLNINEIKEEISGTYKYIYVDEFQDSSPIQFLIFSKLSSIVEKSYWVGDPKQSIFGFRGTDPELIKAVVDEIRNENNKNLQIGDRLIHSWRSTPDIVALCNALFVPALRNQVNEEDIPLEAVRPQAEINDTSLRHWYLKDGTRGRNELKWDHLAENIAELINSETEIVDKEKSNYNLDEEPATTVLRKIKPSDITILCRTNNAVSELAFALKRHGLEVESTLANINETLEVKLLIAALNYLQNPSDQLAQSLIVLLSTPAGQGEINDPVKTFVEERLTFLYGDDAHRFPEQNEGELDEDYALRRQEWYENLQNWKADNKIFKNIKQLKEDVKNLSVPLLVEKLIMEGGLYDLAGLWDNASQRKANLRALVKYAENYVERCVLLGIAPSVNGYISYIENDDDIKLDQSAASGDNAVKVMTYHKAKGLEWPVVVLTNLETDKAEEKEIVKSMFGVNSYRNGNINPENPFEGKSLFLLPWVFGAFNTKVPVDIANRIQELDFFGNYAESRSDEEARLLYVGYTRARDILITTSYNNKRLNWLNHVFNGLNVKFSDIQTDDGEHPIDLYGTGINITTLVKSFDDHINETDILPHTVEMTKKEDKPENGYPRKYISPSDLTNDVDVDVQLVKNFNYRIETGNIPPEAEAELGNCLHHAFAVYQPETDQAEMTELFERIIQNHQLHGQLTHPAHIYQAIRNLYDYLTETYGAPEKIYKELPLQMVEDGMVYRGEADLVWETDNDIVLIDYKSYPGQLTRVTTVNDKFYAGKYAGQLSKYKQMIEQAHSQNKKVMAALIYYHVLGGIVELKI